MSPRLPQGPTPLQFGERYKTKKITDKDIKALHHMALSSAGTVLGGVGTALLSHPGGALSVFSGAGFLASTAGDIEQFNHQKKLQDAADAPPPDTPEQLIQKALERLDADRVTQRARKDEILKRLAFEEARLTELKTASIPAVAPVPATISFVYAFGAKLNLTELKDPPAPVSTGGSEPRKTLTLAEELEQHRRDMAVQGQEQLVARMKVNADAAIVIDNQFEVKMQELKKKYLTMMSQLQQIEQNKKMLEMQKSLEQLKGSDFQSPQLKNIQEQIDSELNKSSALVDSFISDTDVMGQLQKEEQAALIQALRQLPHSQTAGKDKIEVEKKE